MMPMQHQTAAARVNIDVLKLVEVAKVRYQLFLK
jgi:hypothetical protein